MTVEKQGAGADPGGAGADGVAVGGRWRASRGAARFSQGRGSVANAEQAHEAPVALQLLSSAPRAFSLPPARRPPRTSPTAGAPLASITLPPEVDRVLRDYERAWRSGDATAVAALFAEDGYVLQSGRNPVRGRAAIANAYKGQAGGPLRLRAFAYATSDTAGYILGAYGYGEGANVPDQGQVHGDAAAQPRRTVAALLRHGTTGTGHRDSRRLRARRRPRLRRPPRLSEVTHVHARRPLPSRRVARSRSGTRARAATSSPRACLVRMRPPARRASR